MKRTSLIFTVALMLTGGLVFGSAAEEKSAGGPPPAAGHAGHGGMPVPQGAPTPASGPGQAPSVQIPLEKQQLIGVKTVEAVPVMMEKVIRTVGRLQYDETRLATINTKFEGWIEKLYVDYTGRLVKKGEPLAEIYSPELLATQQEFLSVLEWAGRSRPSEEQAVEKMQSRDAEALVRAARERLRLWDITEAQVRKIEETRTPIRTLILYSPVNGYVVQKAAVQGMRVMPGDKLFDLADLSMIWILADIYEYELPMVRVGQSATIRLSYLEGKEFSSKIDFIYPMISGQTRTVKVRFSIPNPDARLKPEMYTSVEVRISLGRRLAVPEDAVIDTGTRRIVYVAKDKGYFEPREVKLGVRGEDNVEVLQGLAEGERVASSATFLIDSEAKLKGVVQ